jgi:peptide/nickel transport system permease protein
MTSVMMTEPSSRARRTGRRLSGLRRNPAAVVAAACLGVGVVVAVLAGRIAPHDPLKTSAQVLQAPSRQHLLGTDYLGRDVLSRVIWGARVSLLVAGVSAGIAAVCGLIVGGVSGHRGGAVDAALMRATDGFMVLPTFFLVLVVVSVFGGGTWFLSAMIGLTSWPSMARLVRGEFLTLRAREFVTAAEAMGAAPLFVIARHILPNALPVIIVNTSLRAGYAMVTEASLGFLGLGDPGAISLGQMLTNTVQFARNAWWVAVFPGAAITVFVLAFSALGDVLNEAAEPEARLTAA